MPEAPWGCFYDGAVPGGTPAASLNIGFFVERGTNQTIVPGETVINLDTVIEESSPGLVDLAGDRFVCPTAGRYGFCLSLDISFSGFFSFGELRMYVNSGGGGYVRRTDERAENDIEDYIKIGNSFYFQLAVGDLVQPRVYNGDSFNATLVGCNNQFSGALIATP